MNQDYFHDIQSGVCVCKADLNEAVRAFNAWQASILEPLGSSRVTEEVRGGVQEVVATVLPKVSPVPTKVVFMPCADGWLAMIDNSFGGTDASLASQLSRLLGCVSARIVAQPQIKKGRSVVRFGSAILEVHQGGRCQRTVYCTNDGGRWRFGQSGEPYSVEDLAKYQQPRVRDRFGIPELQAILSHLGIGAFDLGWYRMDDDHPAIISRRVGNLPKNHHERFE